MGRLIIPIGSTRLYIDDRLSRLVALQIDPEAIGARSKAKSGPDHSHLEVALHREKMELPFDPDSHLLAVWINIAKGK